mmetsp:Transcript_20999/g.48206  ORF Transcript_20999/g.48206 Transcript_20999/m.48206 type:complete len:153 (-) Transcript_20999:110-568(-)
MAKRTYDEMEQPRAISPSEFKVEETDTDVVAKVLSMEDFDIKDFLKGFDDDEFAEIENTWKKTKGYNKKDVMARALISKHPDFKAVKEQAHRAKVAEAYYISMFLGEYSNGAFATAVNKEKGRRAELQEQQQQQQQQQQQGKQCAWHLHKIW